MSAAERETILLMNAEDARQGYFTFSTSIRYDYERLCRRIGGDRVFLSLRINRDAAGNAVEWIAKVPIRYFNRYHFGVKKEKPAQSDQLRTG